MKASRGIALRDSRSVPLSAAFDAKRESAVRALTPEVVNAAIKRHLDYARMISVKAGDFKSAPAAK